MRRFADVCEALDAVIRIGAGAIVIEVAGSPATPNTPGSSVNVIRPAVVPVANTMLGWPFTITAESPAFTVNDATRLLVATNCTAESSVTDPAAGVKLILKFPNAAIGAGADSATAKVCC